MKIRIALAIFLGAITVACADDTIAQAQQALKEQGFYYGSVTGEKNADTTAAIRRFQIRNGLQVTGELNSETMRALVSNNPSPAPTAAATTTPYAKAEPAPESEEGEQDLDGSFRTPPQDRQVYPSSPAIVPPTGGVFAGTPYETAPPPVQRDVIASAQSYLSRHGLYRGEIDGVLGLNTEFSLRAYQARVGLPVTGRLDLETLAALNLLPGPNRQFFGPRRHIPQRFEPPVHGEWIH